MPRRSFFLPFFLFLAIMPTRDQKTQAFDPNGSGIQNQSLFGLPYSPEESAVVAIPVPWDVTSSYHKGSANGPNAILESSPQLDLYSPYLEDAWKHGIAYAPLSDNIIRQNNDLEKESAKWITFLETGKSDIPEKELKEIPHKIDLVCKALEYEVYAESMKWLRQDKIVGIVGGEHSAPLGLMKALGEVKGDYGILQIDAHLDLRKAYQNFTFSHASIMYNALEVENMNRLVSVGIRDYCEEEKQRAEASPKIATFYDEVIKSRLYEGVNWARICSEIVDLLPDQVYISFDIDGLNPHLCPNTGTPVPGGLEFTQASYLINQVVNAGKTIIGFDLCEVSPDITATTSQRREWDGNVGARVLWELYLACLRGVSK